jgi:hypothetical protein
MPPENWFEAAWQGFGTAIFVLVLHSTAHDWQAKFEPNFWWNYPPRLTATAILDFCERKGIPVREGTSSMGFITAEDLTLVKLSL